MGQEITAKPFVELTGPIFSLTCLYKAKHFCELIGICFHQKLLSESAGILLKY